MALPRTSTTAAAAGGAPPAGTPPAGIAGELAALAAELTAAEQAWRELVGRLSPAQLNWRPAPGRWSVGEHLAHLNLVDASYLPALDRMLDADERRGSPGRGRPARHPWLGRHLVRAVEPPVRLKVRTTPAYVPPSVLEPFALLADFAETRRALRDRIDAAAGRDPAAMRARYVMGIGVARFLTLSFGQWLALTAAHDRRHLWLAERVLEAPAFPPRARSA